MQRPDRESRRAAKWRIIYTLNPFVGIIDGYRAVLFGRTPDWKAVATSVVVTLGLPAYSSWQFRKMEKGFAGII